MSTCNASPLEMNETDSPIINISIETKPNDKMLKNTDPSQLAEVPTWRVLPEDPALQKYLPLEIDYTPVFAKEDPARKRREKLHLPDHRAFIPTALFLAAALILSILQWSPDHAWSLYLSKEKLIAGDYWRLVSAIFAHADMSHYLSNAGLIAFFGWLLTGYFGRLGFPFFSFAIGIAANAATITHYPEATRLVGASGMLYGMVGLWLTLFLIKEDSYSLREKVVRTFGVFLMLLFPTQFDPNTSYLAHGYGFLFGVIAGGIFYFIPTGPLSEQIKPRVE